LLSAPLLDAFADAEGDLEIPAGEDFVSLRFALGPHALAFCTPIG
jgi:hypothetical protein